MLTRGQERCIYVFSAREFDDMSDKIRQAPSDEQAGARLHARLPLGGGFRGDPPTSSTGSPSPATLRAYAGLDRDLAVIGAGSRLEIWDATAWQTYLAEQEEAFAETAEEVIPGLF